MGCERMNADKAKGMLLGVVGDPRRSVRSAVVPEGYVHRRNRVRSFETDVSSG
jgi:hypothetical protein